MNEETKPILSMKGIDKSFPGVHALKNVDFELGAGEICGILGEDGAGKSTLMNVLGGVCPSDEGQIFIDGEETHIFNTKIAENLGISFVHQEWSLFENLSLAMNIYIQNLPKRLGRLNKRKLEKNARVILDEVELGHCRPEQRAGELQRSEQQLVEIGRMLGRNVRILILDELTSFLSADETQILFRVVRNIQAKGVAIIFISRRMDEIFEICDSVMIMQDGRRILKTGIRDISRKEFDENLDVSRQSRPQSILGEALQAGGLYGRIGADATEALCSILGLDKYESGQNPPVLWY
ncbi:MAG: ATP-binding cassette domain-containing protein [Christensenellales bacterium]